MDVAVGPAVIGRLIHLQTSNKTERARARKSEGTTQKSTRPMLNSEALLLSGFSFIS